MPQVVEFALEGGGVLLVQPAQEDAPAGLGLASSTEDKVKKARETLESALDHVTPALEVVAGKLRSLSPDEVTVEFGLTLTAETGVVVAKGGAEVHFTVTLAWSRGDGTGGGSVPGGTGNTAGDSATATGGGSG